MDFEEEDYGLIADDGEGRAAGPYSRVRFLHGATGYGPMNITIDDMGIQQLEFGTASRFENVPDGFAMVTITSSRMPRIALCRRNLLFPAGSILTLVIVNSQDGIDLKIVPEL
ncbi:DUF4397 domain-containing protein [Hominifimenecus sp. rT4P-3]|uniref:DUF4397 domain-containing protein n=1 Tax=Hominifimenecus sp. rT4P-3 TaxID=3242979 RepID=UPI003DA2E463